MDVKRAGMLVMMAMLILVAGSVWAAGEITCDPDPQYLTNATPTNTVAVEYDDDPADPEVYGYSISVSWDASRVSMNSITEGNLLSAVGSTWFEVNGSGNSRTVDCVLLGALSGAHGPGTMFTISFTGVSAGTSPVDITINHMRDPSNQDITGISVDDGELVVDVANPSVSGVLITNTTLSSTDYIKDGQDAEVTATVTDGAALGTSDITADLSGLGGGGSVVADSYAGNVATWTLTGVSCSPANGTVTATVTATDPAGNSAQDSDDITSDNSAPVVSDVLITNTTLAHTDDYIKDGDNAQVTATVTDDDPSFGASNIAADLSGLGGGGSVNPDTYVGNVATWTLSGVSCTPANGTVTVTVTATDPLSNTAQDSDGITSDNLAPGAVTGFTAEPGHGKTTLSWDDPSGLDTNYYGVLVRYDGGGDYPQYGTVGSYPASAAGGDDDAYTGTGAGPETHTIAPRDIYYYTAFAYDQALNYGPAASSAQDRATNYFLADLGSGSGTIPGSGYDGLVDSDDLFFFSLLYQVSNPTGTDAEADFGPTVASGSYTTIDRQRLGIPAPDDIVNFEDLIILGMNYGRVPPTKPVALGERVVSDHLGVELRGEMVAGEGGQHLDVAVHLANDGSSVKGVSAVVRFDPSRLSVRNVVSGSLLGVDGEDALLLHRVGEGMVQLDGVVLGVDRGVAYSGDVGVVRFDVHGMEIGDLELTEVQVRDVMNRDLGVASEGLSLVSAALPSNYGLAQNHPNPFNPETAIRYQLPEAGYVKLVILNALGQRVRTLVDGHQEAGSYRAVWDGRSASGEQVSDGLYLYRMEAGRFSRTRKMMLVK